MERLYTNTVTLNEVINTVDIQTSKCEDIMCDTKDITFLDLNTVAIRGCHYKIDHWAMTQLCSRLEIPYNYFVKCMNKCEYLAHSTFHTWSTLNQSPVLLRLYSGKIVGVLSSKYSTFDNQDVMNVVGNVDSLQTMEIRNHLITPSRFHLRMTTPEPFLDDLYTGIQVDNSQVGKSNFSILFMVYKQVCTNGLIADINNSKVFVKKHIGDLKGSSNEIIEKLTKLSSYTAKMEDGIKSSMVDSLNYLDVVNFMEKLVESFV